ncbi:hypothetical protein ANO11243_083750 [Dothideomycetidae sp. 11243]|nr:hypothetical protein ANO11243_083750 [fungal sp. No.11243]
MSPWLPAQSPVADHRDCRTVDPPNMGRRPAILQARTVLIVPASPSIPRLSDVRAADLTTVLPATSPSSTRPSRPAKALVGAIEHVSTLNPGAAPCSACVRHVSPPSCLGSWPQAQRPHGFITDRFVPTCFCLHTGDTVSSSPVTEIHAVM